MTPNVSRFLKSYLPVRLFTRRSLLNRNDTHRAVRVQKFQPLGLHDFLSLDVPPRAMLLNPILPERSLSMIFAPRGLGKSWLGLSIGLAVASGSDLLRWQAPAPRRVLYVDGEMIAADLQQRLTSISAGLRNEIPQGGFVILAADNTEDGINLGSVEGQQALERHLDDVDLVILDNLSTLMANGSEGASDAWLPIQKWLLGLRRKGIAVLIIHHAGVNGRQRGTSRREDALDAVIALRRPENYSPAEGARFEVHFEKMRHHAGAGGEPFEAAVVPFETKGGRSGVRWAARDLKPPLVQRAAELFAAGKSVREVGVAIGVSRSEAGRLRQRAVLEGLLDEGEDEEEKVDILMNGNLLPN